MIVNGHRGMVIPDAISNPFMNGDIEYTGRWSAGFEVYDGKLYAEAILATSGSLTCHSDYTVDIWAIGAGGGTAKGKTYGLVYFYIAGGGSGYTNMLLSAVLKKGTHAITIGTAGKSGTEPNWAGGSEQSVDTTDGGETRFGSLLTAGGGKRGVITYDGAIDFNYGLGGSNGGAINQNNVITEPGENGIPGDGQIMSKFYSLEHKNDYVRKSYAAGQAAVNTPAERCCVAGGWGDGNYGSTAQDGVAIIRIPLE